MSLPASVPPFPIYSRELLTETRERLVKLHDSTDRLYRQKYISISVALLFVFAYVNSKAVLDYTALGILKRDS